ncbi:MAG: glycosyltransferase [Terriglobia bacterium]
MYYQMQQSATLREAPIFLMTNSFERGGSERQFVVLAGALKSAQLRVEIGCLEQIGPFRDGFAGVKEFPAGGNLYGLHSLRSRMALKRHLQGRSIAVAHAFDFYSNLMLIPAARFAGVPVVIGSHRQLGDLLGPSRFAAQGVAFRFCDRVVCNSRAAAARLLDQGLPERKIALIPNGLPEEAFRPAEPALPRRPGIARIGMVARMNSPVKNYPGLLHAAARLVPKFPEIEVLLVGDGPLRPELERLAATLRLQRHVRFLGDRTDVSAVLASMDISVLTSFSESLPNAILESMAAGLPVVATRVGGNCDLVREGETGLLVPPNEEISLASALERLLVDPMLRSQFGRRAREIARADYSLERVRELYEQLYADLLDRKRWAGSRPHNIAASSGRRGSDASRSSQPEAVIPEQSPAGGADPPGAAAARTKLSVAIVAPSLRYLGGQAVQADFLLRHWRNDAEVEAWFVPVDPPFPRWLRGVARVPVARTAVRTPLYLAGLWRGLKGADVAHIFSASYWSFLLAPFPALMIAKARGAKALINYHSGEARDHLSHWKTALPVLRAADSRVVPSGYLIDVFREFGLGAKIVPNAIDLGQFSYRPRLPLRPWFICSRGFGAYYSVDHVVRAFAHVKREFSDARLLLLGSGPQESEVRQLVRSLKLDGVEFTGPVPRDEIGAWYDRADIFINASWLDNMPISILEAFAAGAPVVTTAPEGIKYIVEHERTGLLCPPGDWQALAENAQRLLRDPGLASRLAENAHKQSRQYQWEAVREKWLAVYRGLEEAGAHPVTPTPAELRQRSAGGL